MVISVVFMVSNALLPLIFLGGLFISHSILAVYSKKDPQIAQIIFSYLRIFKNKIPKRLVV